MLPPFSFIVQGTDSRRDIIKGIGNVVRVTYEQGVKVILNQQSPTPSPFRERERERYRILPFESLILL